MFRKLKTYNFPPREDPPSEEKPAQARIVEIRKSKLWGNPNFTTGQALRQSSGQAALALVFLIGSAIVLIGATLAFLVYNFVHSTSGFQAANRALGVALAGANDALVRLAKDRSFNVDGIPNCKYSFNVGEDKAEVQVLWGVSTCDGSGKPSCPFENSNLPGCRQVAVNVDSSVSGRRRRIEMLVSVDAVTGEVNVASLRQKLGGWGGVSSDCSPNCL